MLCFCPEIKNEDELLLLFNQGRFDKRIYDYLIEIMIESENKILQYDPVELFEMQAVMSEKNELLYLQFWNLKESGIYENWHYKITPKQREIFDLFVVRIREIYQSLQRLAQ